MEDGKQQESKDKKQRKRMKAVYAQIREQMEFYFSDSNLQKDRFLKKQYTESEDGYIDLSIFLSFNRIRALTTDVSTLAKALSSSTLLKVSENGTKVKRLTPLLEPKDLDKRTVYVECLPHHVDHEWVKRLFSACGKVVYVSLPRYKTTKDPKGFAFVEFETVEAAKKACEELNNPPVEAEERLGRFPKTSKTLSYWQKKAGNPTDEQMEESEVINQTEQKSKVHESPTKSVKKLKKHKREASDSSLDGALSDPSPIKRRKTLSKDSNDGEGNKSLTEPEGQGVGEGLKSEEDDVSPRKKRKKSKSRSKSDPGNISSENEVSESATDNQDSVKQNKKRKTSGRDSVESFEPPSKLVKVENENKNKTEIENDSTKDDNTKDSGDKKKRKRKRKKKSKEKDLPELRVISKSEWLLLRNEYLQLQKQNMVELKKKIITTDKSDSKSSTQSNKENKEKEKTHNRPVLEFIPDVIVEVKSNESLCRKKLREHIGSDVQVAYIDVQDGKQQGYIRFKDKDSAKKIANSTTASYTFKLVQGTDEKTYWDKLQSDRNAKYDKTSNKTKKRGSQKLIDKAPQSSKTARCQHQLVQQQ